MADLELELAQFSFSSAIRGHHVYLATHLRMRIAFVNVATVQGRPLLRLARVLIRGRCLFGVRRLFKVLWSGFCG